MIIRHDSIGGGIVQRTFSIGARRLMRGAMLTAAEVMGIPVRNRESLIDSHHLEVYPAAPAAAGTERIVIRSKGFASKTYDVIEGKRIADGLTKEQAEAVAAGAPTNETTN